MSDLADILGVSKEKKTVKRVFEPTSLDSNDKLPKYLNNIVDDKTPPSSVPSFTEKGFQINKKPANKWKYASFKSSARSDGAIFYHWVKDGVEYPDYPFARFNITNNILKYTEDEYNHIKELDKWKKEETDALFDLCRRYDLRWPVIYDEWKTLYGYNTDHLEEQYYYICKCIYTYRKKSNIQLTENEEELLNYVYNNEYIQKRRTQLDRLFFISSIEEKEEMKIRERIKKIDQQLALLGVDSMKEKDFMEFEDIPSVLKKMPSISCYVPPNTSLRSQTMISQPCINIIPEGISKKIDMIMEELGLAGIPIMSTEHITEATNKVKQDILKVLMLKKYIKQELERANITQNNKLYNNSQLDSSMINKKRRKIPPMNLTSPSTRSTTPRN